VLRRSLTSHLQLYPAVHRPAVCCKAHAVPWQCHRELQAQSGRESPSLTEDQTRPALVQDRIWKSSWTEQSSFDTDCLVIAVAVAIGFDMLVAAAASAVGMPFGPAAADTGLAAELATALVELGTRVAAYAAELAVAAAGTELVAAAVAAVVGIGYSAEMGSMNAASHYPKLTEPPAANV